jgi:hypothetical protein
MRLSEQPSSRAASITCPARRITTRTRKARRSCRSTPWDRSTSSTSIRKTIRRRPPT